ncbi:MAG: LLM class flavin-dependent oxidoreductase [Pseudomonadota bacterium]|nr:LLM class flavin-dependent oxidoreductase [Pseudomonadota bacterium]
MTKPSFDGLDIGLFSVSSTADNLAVAQKAEARGFKRVWLAEDYHSRDLIVQATAVATGTNSIQIGLGIINPFTRHPAQVAMAVADIEEFCGPRLILGFGAGHTVINAHGLENPRPITALKEASEICRRLLDGERVIYEGQIYRLPAPGVKLRFSVARSGIPMYFGTMGPRTLKRVARVADGVKYSVFTSPAFARKCMVDLKEALVGTARSIEDLDTSCYIIFSVDRDRDAARNAAKPLVAHYLRQIPDMTRYVYAGLDVPRVQMLQDNLRTAFLGEKFESAVANIPDDVVDSLAVTGTPDECVEKLKGYSSVGIKTPVLYQVLGPNRIAAIDVIADFIRPKLLAE